MYDSRLQMDVLWFLRMEQRKCAIKDMRDNHTLLPNKEEDIKKLFQDILEYSFRGFQYYNYVKVIKNHTTTRITPIEIFVDWCKDIIDCCYYSSQKERYSKIYKEFVMEHFNIDGFDRKNEPIKNGELLWKIEKTFDFLKQLCKFNISKLANKGYINKRIFNERFDSNKKYYLVNHFNPCYYDKEYSFDEVKELIANKKFNCAITKDGVISIYALVENKCRINGYRWKFAFENVIIAEDMFSDMKNIVEDINNAINKNNRKQVEYLSNIYYAHTEEDYELRNKINNFFEPICNCCRCSCKTV